MKTIVASFFLTIFFGLAYIGWLPEGTLAEILDSAQTVGMTGAVERAARLFCDTWLIMGLIYGLASVALSGTKTVHVSNLSDFFEEKVHPKVSIWRWWPFRKSAAQGEEFNAP